MRIFAANGSPFQETGTLICRKGDKFGVWWWDQAGLDQALRSAGYSANVTLIPEVFFKQAGVGAQIIRSGTGYSSQAWDHGFLVADQWTKAPPTSDEWADFLRLADLDWVEIPKINASPYVSSSPYLDSILANASLQTWGRMAASLIVAVLAATTLFLLGQALRLNIENHQIKRQLASTGPQSQSRTEAFKAQVKAVSMLDRNLSQVQPVAALKAAQGILSPFGYKLSRFAFDEKQATFDLPAEASVGVDLVAEELEASPYFSQVEPTIDRARNRLVFTMKIDPITGSGRDQIPK